MKKKIEIYYDGDCPFCTQFVLLSKLKKEYEVSINNLRNVPDKVKEFKEKLYDVNEGMVVIFDNEVYFGHKAVYLMTKLSDKNLNQPLSLKSRKYSFKNTIRKVIKLLT